MRLNYIVIPLAVIAVSVIGSMFTGVGIGGGWYATIAKPDWTPPGSVIGTVWTVIFILSALSAGLVWNIGKIDKRTKQVIVAFVVNGVLNVSWSYIFFVQQWLGLAVLEAAVLAVSVGVIMVLAWKRSRVAVLLLVPYVSWVLFATFLSYTIWRLN